jgi:hypothetical protein
MKNIIIVIAIAIATLIANFVNASETLSGNTLTKFGTYQLKPSATTVVIDDVAFKTWELTYSDIPEKFVLFAAPEKDGSCEYTVRGKDFEIGYKVSYDEFGAQFVAPKFKTIARKEITKKINADQLRSQELISSEPKTEAEYLGLIACFMPLLMN